MGRGRAAYAAAGASCAATAWGLLRMARFAGSRHALPRVSAYGGPWPVTVSAVVPARDEAAGITRCVSALCRTGRELVEVLVVDDDSADATAELARGAGDARLRVIHAPVPARGWAGKPAACAAGAEQATGEWLWFVDADVEVAPDTLRRLLACAEETRSSMVSVLGRIETSGAATAWLLPEVGLALARRLSLDAVADPSARTAFASGQCLLVRREVYDLVGGHRAVVDEAAEDLALARVAGLAGVGQRVALAPDAFAVRMYASVPAAWRGLLKNSAAVRGTSASDVVRELAWAAAAAAPVVLAASRRVPGGARRLAAAATLAQIATSAGARATAGMPVWPAAGAPAAEVALVANWAWSLALRRAGRPVAWRGRDVPVA